MHCTHLCIHTLAIYCTAAWMRRGAAALLLLFRSAKRSERVCLYAYATSSFSCQKKANVKKKWDKMCDVKFIWCCMCIIYYLVVCIYYVIICLIRFKKRQSRVHFYLLLLLLLFLFLIEPFPPSSIHTRVSSWAKSAGRFGLSSMWFAKNEKKCNFDGCIQGGEKKTNSIR